MHSDPAQPPHTESHDAIAVARVRFLYDGMPMAMTATVVLSGITTLILYSVQPSALLLGWFGSVVLLSAARTLQYRAYRKAVHDGIVDWSVWRRRFLIGCSMVGALWGFASVFLFPPSIEYQVFLAFVIAGTSAGAVTTLSSDRAAALGFVLPSVIPLAAMLMLQGTQLGLAMGIMVVLYLMLVVTATYRSHLQLIEMVRWHAEADAKGAALARSELERRVSDERLRALFEYSPLGIALLNDRNGVLDANPALVKLVGATAADIKQRALGAALDRLTTAPEGEDALTSTGLFGPIEYEITTDEGRTVPVAINGMRIKHPSGEIYRWAFIEDIHERKRTETQLRALNDRLLLAAQAAQIGVWEYEGRTGKVYWDERMFKMFQLDPDGDGHLLERWGRLVHPSDAMRTDALVQAAIRGEAGFQTEFRAVLPNGEERSIRAAAMVRRDPDNSVRITGVSSDVTELKRVERLKNEFIATVSHELRTPLTSIRAALSLVASGAAGELPQQQQQLLTIADRNASRLALLIDDLLDIERIEAGELNLEISPQPLVPLIAQAVEANTAYAKLCGVHLELAPCTSDPIVRVDANRLLQVMANLLSNAAKFSGRGARVDVRVTVLGADSEAQSVASEATRARVAVCDQGPGIVPELRQRLFTKFSQGDSSDSRASGGTGLGLAISKALIEQMGGTIDYDSPAGGGTTFYFDLPLAPAEASVS
ncbi:MAG: ATP-binding protein [Steroidobacteraceae bacterium]